MSIEEAEYILNDVVIDHPSINSYTYISAEDINGAINKVLEERDKDKKRIMELEQSIIQEKSKLEEIRKGKLEKTKYPSKILRNQKIYLGKFIKYIKKIAKLLFPLEN